MENTSKIILNQALDLPPNKRAILAEQILLSLDLPDAKIDEFWATEAEVRIDEYEKGNIKTKKSLRGAQGLELAPEGLGMPSGQRRLGSNPTALY